MSRKFFSQSSLLSGTDGVEERTKHVMLPRKPLPIMIKAPSRSSFDFAGLGEDIHHLILTELQETCSSTLLSLALVSKAVNQITTPYIYRTVLLKRVNPSDRKSRSRFVFDQLLKRLRDENGGEIAKHIRHLIVEEISSNNDIETILGKIKNLKIFEWNTSLSIPPAVLSTLQTKWPDVKLIVRNHLRHVETRADIWDLDENLLRSPQLKVLDIDILTEGYGDGSISVNSEWPQLSYLLITGCRPSSMHIHVKHDNMRRVRTRRKNAPYSDRDLTRLLLGPNTTLSALEELSIIRINGAAGYYFDPTHSKMLARCMDWSKMKKLDFGQEHPHYLFRELTNQLPNLKSLQFGFWDADIPNDDARLFIDSLNGLESLEIYNVAKFIRNLWSAVAKHGDTLRTLNFPLTRSAYGDVPVMEIEGFEDMVRDCCGLEYLAFHVPFEAEELNGDIQPILQNPYMQQLRNLNLRTLDLYVHLPGAGTKWSAKYEPDVFGRVPVPKLNVDRVVKDSISIAENISKAEQQKNVKQRSRPEEGGRPLERLNVHISRTGYTDRYQPYHVDAKVQLTRNVRDDAESLGEDTWAVKRDLVWKTEW